MFFFFKVYWLFNGLPITRLQRYQQDVFNDRYTLTIHNIRYEDVGKYTLNVENSWGKATCTAKLLVLPIFSSIGKKEFNEYFPLKINILYSSCSCIFYFL